MLLNLNFAKISRSSQIKNVGMKELNSSVTGIRLTLFFRDFCEKFIMLLIQNMQISNQDYYKRSLLVVL